jgi:hypothetical protein
MENGDSLQANLELLNYWTEVLVKFIYLYLTLELAVVFVEICQVEGEASLVRGTEHFHLKPAGILFRLF